MIGSVITTINPNQNILTENIEKFAKFGYKTYVPLDRKVKQVYSHPFINFKSKPENDFEYICDFDSYSRKNIGYIRAANEGCDFILETDDDNLLLKDVNTYLQLFDEDLQYYSSDRSSINIFNTIYKTNNGEQIWARGYPISKINQCDLYSTANKLRPGVIQFLISNHPDVDAIVRLVKGEDITYELFQDNININIHNIYHPFNSQGTLWPKEFFPLLYLPSTCSFRMTDIWRGYVAQAILYKLERTVLFSDTLFNQKRNKHIIYHDFQNEYEGYDQTHKVIEICSNYASVNIIDSMYNIYDALLEQKIILKKELILLNAFLNEIQK